MEGLRLADMDLGPELLWDTEGVELPVAQALLEAPPLTVPLLLKLPLPDARMLWELEVDKEGLAEADMECRPELD